MLICNYVFESKQLFSSLRPNYRLTYYYSQMQLEITNQIIDSKTINFIGEFY